MSPKQILHPWMLVLYPILFLFAHNIGEMSPKVVVAPLLISLLVALILWWVMGKAFHSAEKSALLTSFFLFLFFSYGHFEKALNKFNVVVCGFYIGPTKLLLFLSVVLSVVVLTGLWRTKYRFGALTQLLNVTSVALVLFTLVKVGIFYFQQPRGVSPSAVSGPERGTETAADGQLPDIYYIILDEYLRDDVLWELYHFDNRPFLTELTRRGFFIASASRSNYSSTALSISSSLNLRYINKEVAQLAEAGSHSRITMAELIENNFLANFLRSRGYLFVSMNTGYWVTQIDNADVIVSSGNDEFLNQLVNTTILSLEQDINKRLLGRSLYDTYMTRMQRRRIIRVFENLQKMPEVSSPKLVFAHLVSPHPPFIFGPNGEEVLFNAKWGIFNDDVGLFSLEGMTHEQFNRKYGHQVQYLNSMLLQSIDAIRQQSRRPVIIILQGDHGPRSLYEWENSDDAEHYLMMLRERMCIFNAYYLPDNGQEILYPTITPVNTFRLILNRYFGQKWEPLPDRVYFSGAKSYKYFHLKDVTAMPLARQGQDEKINDDSNM